MNSDVNATLNTIISIIRNGLKEAIILQDFRRKTQSEQKNHFQVMKSLLFLFTTTTKTRRSKRTKVHLKKCFELETLIFDRETSRKELLNYIY